MFKCEMCNYVFSYILLYNKHQILHKNMPYLKIICLFKNCGQQFNKYFNFKKHILRQHSTDNKKQTSITFYCKEQNCNAYFKNTLNFNKHLYKHIRQNKIGIYCGYPACSTNKIFKTVSTYAVHICRHHSNYNFNKQFIANEELINFETSNFDINNNINFFLQKETLNKVFCDVNNSERAIAQLYLNLTTKYFLTQPEKYIDTETEETIEDKAKFLRQIVHEDSSNDLKIQHKINSYLEATYPAQRLFLNNVHKTPTIEDVKTTWPILLQKNYMFWHYEKLMGHSIDLLKKEILKKQENILSYGQHKKYKDIIDSNNPAELKLIKIIMKHFKEDFEELFKTYPEGTALEDIEPPIVAPCIVIINDPACRMFYLYIEKLLIERTYCFYEALKMLMSVYYIFNMEYPRNSTCTLEFLQKYFLNIHPACGSKSRKVSTKYKVLSLFNKLRSISDQENIATDNM